MIHQHHRHGQQLQSPFKSQPSLFLSRHPQFQFQFRLPKRRRRRRLKSVTLRCLHLPFQSQFENFLNSVSSQFSPDDLLPSAVAFASGAVLSLSQRFTGKGGLGSRRRDIGEWILFSSPTPFNRFVLLRCPSVSFEGSELLEDVNERLVTEDRHYVRLSTGRMQVRAAEADRSWKDSGSKLDYQRLCVGTEDGGVISLDWPANLDLKEERGLDSTLLMVPGTAEGSMDKDVRAFVLEALQRGFFPVVMNPRGCAGSPLTTARLFTAADSDDISTAIQFIIKARPWATVMGVGWGFGANMLTKYLAEVGERTPLTAATCINNPFDLEEATRSFPYRVAVDEKLAGGLRDILRANKELFQGKLKGFDVEKALSSNSVRDFDKAISMVSYEFDAIEDFYSRSSTRNLVGSVKVPVLFIQNDDGTVPIFSVPRGKIAENPYTSLLLCSSSSVNAGNIFALSWCQNLTIEWLAAVELGLLKGRHPLLRDVDISINLSKGLSLIGDNLSNDNTKINEIFKLNEVNGYSTMIDSMPNSRSELKDTNEDFPVTKERGLQQSGSINADLVKGEEETSLDAERGQVLRSAEVVLNMLDITTPGTLTEDKKKKVLTAMSQGETLMKALHDAVPEDVRGKITNAVSGILQDQGPNLKLSKIDIGHIPNVPPILKSKKEEATNDVSSPDASPKDNESSDQPEKAGTSGPESGSSEDQQLRHSSGLDTDPQKSSKSDSTDEDEIKRNAGESGNSFDSGELSKEKSSESPVSKTGTSCSEEVATVAVAETEAKEEVDGQMNQGRSSDSLSEEKNMTTAKADDVQSSSETSSDGMHTDIERKDDQKIENRSTQSASNSKPFSVTEALNALTDIDDSTQVAVNSIFGVLEEMISQLEEGSVDEDGKGKESGALPLEHERTQAGEIEEKEVSNKDSGSDAHHIGKNGFYGDEVAQSSGRHDTFDKIGRGENIENYRLVNSRYPDKINVDSLRLLNGIRFDGTGKPYWGLLHDENVRRYLFSKLPKKSLDMDATAALLLDYNPEEGQWKLLEPGIADSDATAERKVNSMIPKESSATVGLSDGVIDAPYVVMDTEEAHPPAKEYNMKDGMGKQGHIIDVGLFQPVNFMKKIILDSLKVEVDRRIDPEDRKEMEPSLSLECELVADAVCSAVGRDGDLALYLKARSFSNDHSHEQIGTLRGELIVESLSSAIQETNYLKSILPVGLLVGSCLAALREFFNVVTAQDNGKIERESRDICDSTENKTDIFTDSAVKETILVEKSHEKTQAELNNKHSDHLPVRESGKTNLEDVLQKGDQREKTAETRSKQVMVGVVTAALGTSALLVNQQEMGGGNESVPKPFKEEGTQKKELGELSSENDHTNLVTSLAEKAMSVAAPVVPTKEDGEVDQDRLVAILAELGQRGGLLKLVGKVALFWGGLRGAMSFTDKLISFLRIAELPLIQRIVSFACMVVVLWSPILVPLLPTLVQNWTSRSSSKFAEFACIVGLYAAVVLLVMQWGRRIRGYEKPFVQYGLDLTSSQKVHDLVKGLVGGVILILAIQFVNSLIGCTALSWPPGLPSPSSDITAKLMGYAKVLLLVGRGFMTAIAIAAAEELLFRAWLPGEIATDLGYHWGVVLSGLAFSLLQRPPWALPGLWLLSLSLSGIRHRNEGSLCIPIGVRAGIIATNYILQTGGFITVISDVPHWIIRTHTFQPFCGVVGMSFALILAIILYPREAAMKKKLTSTIRE